MKVKIVVAGIIVFGLMQLVPYGSDHNNPPVLHEVHGTPLKPKHCLLEPVPTVTVILPNGLAIAVWHQSHGSSHMMWRREESISMSLCGAIRRKTKARMLLKS